MNLDDLLADLKRSEGLRLKPYTDTTGHVSIGYGRNLSDVGITTLEAEDLLMHDVASTIGALGLRLPWFPTLDGIRQRVLIELAFNMGVEKLQTFHRMLEAIRTGEWEDAHAELLTSKWATQVQPERRDRIARMLLKGTP